MKSQEIIEEIGETEVWDNAGAGRWIDAEEISKQQNCIIYRDDGGDTFIKIAANEQDLVEKLKKHLNGDTGCDFDTSISLIIRNGQKVKVSDFLK